MTVHYGQTITAQQIWDGWYSHGCNMPAAYAICTPGDRAAFYFWKILTAMQQGQEGCDMETMDATVREYNDDERVIELWEGLVKIIQTQGLPEVTYICGNCGHDEQYCNCCCQKSHFCPFSGLGGPGSSAFHFRNSAPPSPEGKLR